MVCGRPGDLYRFIHSSSCVSLFRRRSRCWLTDMASFRRKPARRRSRWEYKFQQLVLHESCSCYGRTGLVSKLDMHVKWRCMPLTWTIGLRVRGASWVLGELLLIIYILLYIIIYIHILKAWSRVSFWSGVPKWCCSSNAFDVLFKKAWFIQVVMLFFPHFQFSPLSAMPALLTCPAASEVAAPGGPSIDVGEVIRQNLERTRAQDGLSAVWINNYYYQDWRHSCVQDVAAMEMISPSSSASEMEPVKDPNQCWLILWKRVRSV